MPNPLDFARLMLPGVEPATKEITRGVVDARYMPQEGVYGRNGNLTVYADPEAAQMYPIGEVSRMAPRDAVLLALLRQWRAYCRELYDTEGYFQAAVESMVDAIVGDGIKLMATPRKKPTKREPLGAISQSRAMKIERAWKQWGCKDIDYRGELTLYEIECLIVRSLFIDGEFIAIVHKTGPYGYQLEVVDPDLLDIQQTNMEERDSYLSLGVERDKRTDRPLRYWFATDSSLPTGSLWGLGNHARRQPQGWHRKVPAKDVLHIFRREYAQQSRGVPLMASGSRAWYEIKRFVPAIVKSTIARSTLMGAVEPDSQGNPGMDGKVLREQRAEIPTHGKARQKKQADEPALPAVVSGFRNREGVGIFNAQGRVNWNDNTLTTSEQIVLFGKQLVQGGLSPSGVAAFFATNDYANMSFSTAKAAMIAMKGSVMKLRKLMVQKFHERVYNDWLWNAWTMSFGGQLRYPIPTDSPFDSLSDATFRGKAMEVPQPEKQADANEKRLKSGTTTRIAIIEEEGGDWEEHLDNLRREELARERPREPDVDDDAEDDAGGNVVALRNMK